MKHICFIKKEPASMEQVFFCFGKENYNSFVVVLRNLKGPLQVDHRYFIFRLAEHSFIILHHH